MLLESIMDTKAFRDVTSDAKFYGDRKLTFYSEKGLQPTCTFVAGEGMGR